MIYLQHIIHALIFFISGVFNNVFLSIWMEIGIKLDPSFFPFFSFYRYLLYFPSSSLSVIYSLSQGWTMYFTGHHLIMWQRQKHSSFLGQPVPLLATLMVEQFLLLSNLNVPSCNLWLLSFVMLSASTELLFVYLESVFPAKRIFMDGVSLPAYVSGL